MKYTLIQFQDFFSNKKDKLSLNDKTNDTLEKFHIKYQDNNFEKIYRREKNLK